MTSRPFSFVLFALLTLPAVARAQDDATEQARAEFVRGADLVKRSQWGEALVAFERADKLRPHAVTTYNIGICQRATGRYTIARQTFLRALVQGEASGELPPSLVTDTKGFIQEIDASLATFVITLEPATASVVFDGRPLDIEDAKARPPVLVAGVLAPGYGGKPPASTFAVRADPGTHVITLSRQGYTDALVTKTVAPGSTTPLNLKLDTLPATIHVASDPTGGIVTIDGDDVGITPADVIRGAGSHRVTVHKSGFVTYDTQVTTHAGENVNLQATLSVQKKSIAQRWWFWTGVGAVVVGAVVATAVAVQASQPPQPRPPLDGGGLGWTVPAQ